MSAISRIFQDAGMEYKLVVWSDETSIAEITDMCAGLNVEVVCDRFDTELKSIIDNDSIKLALLDGRELPRGIYMILDNNRIPAISFDDYGYGSRHAEILANPLFSFRKKSANFNDIYYTPVAMEYYTMGLSSNDGEILISFGGSDPQNLAKHVVDALDGRKAILIAGPLAKYEWIEDYENLEVVTNPSSLVPYIARVGVVFTTVGLTMVEALIARRRVIAVNPYSYHDRIARSVKGITNIGMGKDVSRESVNKALDIEALDEALDDNNGFDFQAWINTLAEKVIEKGIAKCPVCGSTKREVLQRRKDATLFGCKQCRSNYLYSLNDSLNEYDAGYFDTQYTSAYGTSYENDIENIREYSRRRLGVIHNLFGEDKGTLLDVGCALGVFADEANHSGFKACGAEISSHARCYAKDKFGVKCFESVEDVEERFDVITMWFALEHIEHPSQWIAKAHTLLNPGGILAIGMPNGNGAFANRNRDGYVKARPEEHYFEPSPKGMRKLLSSNGFKTEKVEYFGLHPDRYGFADWGILKTFQKLLRAGDTFEIYARKLDTSD